MTDSELLEQHRQGAKDAFAQLVHRHIDWVYSAARRRVNDAHLAEDVTQAVFEVLARKMPRLKPSQTLSIWLFGVLNLTCKAQLRKESRRHHHETEAARMRSEIDNAEPELWQEISPRLDEVVGKLRHDDRQAVLLRFYEQKSFAEVGQILGIGEEAARKRVSRAIEKLRARMAVKGGAVSASVVSGILLAETTKSAPPALAGTISTASTATSLGKAAIVALSWTHAKVAACIALFVIVLTGGTVAALMQLSSHAPPTNTAPTTQIAGSAARARELLTRYQQSLDALSRIHYRFRVETKYEGDYNFDAVPKFKLIETGEVFRDGARSSTLKITQRLSSPDAHPTDSNIQHYIIGPDHLNPGDALTFQSFLSQPADKWTVLVDTHPSPALQMLFAVLTEELWGLMDGEGDVQPLPQLLMNETNLSVRKLPELIDGHETLVVDAQTTHGMHSLWIDPGAGYFARRIEVHKSGNDWDGRGPLNVPPPPLARQLRGHIYPYVVIKTHDIVADHFQIDQIGDVFVPVSDSVTDKRTFVDGKVTIRRAESKREEIDLHPDFAAAHAFTLDVPDGTHVEYMDKQKPDDPRFEWQQGKVIQIKRLYGRAVGQDGTPLQITWRAQLRPDGEPRASVNGPPEDIRPDGLFSVSLTSSERELLMKNCAGQIEIYDRSGTLGGVNVSELSTDRDHPPQFTFPRK